MVQRRAGLGASCHLLSDPHLGEDGHCPLALPGAEGGWQSCRLPPPRPADRHMAVSILEPRAMSSLSRWGPSRATVRTSGFFMSLGDPHTRFSRCDQSVCFLTALMLNWHPRAPGFLPRKHSSPEVTPLPAGVGGGRAATASPEQTVRGWNSGRRVRGPPSQPSRCCLRPLQPASPRPEPAPCSPGPPAATVHPWMPNAQRLQQTPRKGQAVNDEGRLLTSSSGLPKA